VDGARLNAVRVPGDGGLARDLGQNRALRLGVLIKMMNLKDFRRLAIGDNVLVRSGRVASGEQGAQYHLTRPDTPATVVGFRKIGRDPAVSVRLEDGSHGVFRYLDVSRAF
jgi:hypothetical protein